MAKNVRKLQLAIKVHDGNYSGEEWGFTIEEPMPSTVDIIEHISKRLSEELKRHLNVIPDKLKPLEIEAGNEENLVKAPF